MTTVLFKVSMTHFYWFQRQQDAKRISCPLGVIPKCPWRLELDQVKVSSQTLSSSPMWVAGTQALKPTSTDFPMHKQGAGLEAELPLRPRSLIRDLKHVATASNTLSLSISSKTSQLPKTFQQWLPLLDILTYSKRHAKMQSSTCLYTFTPCHHRQVKIGSLCPADRRFPRILSQVPTAHGSQHLHQSKHSSDVCPCR